MKIYLKGLNGIRTIAAIGVIISHINIWRSDFNVPNASESLLAPYGVTMFFALSGFLITYLLLQEKEISENKIAIKKFYIRRILRIWPLYFLYLSMALLTIYLYQPSELHTYSIVFYFILMANIPFVMNIALPYLGHYWSLAVEEQFYLFWPWLVKAKNEFKALSIFLILYTLFRIVIHFIIKNIFLIYFFDTLRFDCMAIGGLAAVLLYQKHPIINYVYHPVCEIISWLSLAFVCINHFHIASIFDQDIFSITTVILIINQCTNPKVLISLDKKILNFLGKISFGIYVYHPLVIFLFAQLLNRFVTQISITKYIFIYSGVISITIFIAYISYEYFEKYFLNIRSKFTVVQSSNSIK
jgi:peptidoglycan/LPS O-acetylase OafA/YrhL